MFALAGGSGSPYRDNPNQVKIYSPTNPSLHDPTPTSSGLPLVQVVPAYTFGESGTYFNAPGLEKLRLKLADWVRTHARTKKKQHSFL